MKIMIYLKPLIEEYDVRIYVYSDEGKLLDTKNYIKVKQVVLRTKEIRVSRQIFYDQLAMIAETTNPRIDYKEGGVLYIEDSP